MRFVEGELLRACRVLFGKEVQASRDFLGYLQTSGVKAAYRRRALETHPDRAGFAKGVGADRFAVVHRSYEALMDYISTRERGTAFIHKGSPASRPTVKTNPSYRRPRSRGHSASKGGRAGSGFGAGNIFRESSSPAKLYKGPIPKRKLLFGHYLYYSGLTSWQTIVQALIWQRSKRPKIGELGRRFGWLEDGDILKILRGRTINDTFGRSAVALGLLNESQLRLLLARQKRLQKKFGAFFVANDLMSARDIDTLLRRFQRHNMQVGAQDNSLFT